MRMCGLPVPNARTTKGLSERRKRRTQLVAVVMPLLSLTAWLYYNPEHVGRNAGLSGCKQHTLAWSTSVNTASTIT